jgi:class 3 adenylate cyclase
VTTAEKDMAEFSNRTFICSVLYLDIVDFSTKAVAEQIWMKERFNDVLTEAIAGVGADDRIILDTGGGAALSFLGDPEDALFTAVSVRDAFATHAPRAGLRARIRVGINLGLVGLVKDMNGKPVIVGDGIKMAQHIMFFAEPGQILVSRSYRDVMVRLSERYANLFHYEGVKTDTNVREHWVYAVNAAASSVFRQQGAKR